ncbi:SOS response-associated peptidase [Nordella sp. HKS 07]|uniref:SOS response-associated peptidase n=1 Tax=Nordella sp. HKS 07 TaxID=2712222 RepID=UPI0013E1A1D4|nr:SOS response-associated peptidase [Nordella sp. HKS 07]QIG46989.1 SOS response-associated peptidase [Nordella sp. HKS 07]
MCGRIFDPDEVSETKLNPFRRRAGDYWLWKMPRRFNVPPTMPVPAMTSKDGVRTVEPMRWGLIPSWAKDMKGGFSTFNARADTVDSKASFRSAWKAGRRCLVLAGGFFEWRRAGIGDKQPFAIAMGNHQIMPLAGLWESWKDPQTGEWLKSCTVITTEANELMAPIHDRMPVVLGEEDWARWLGEEPANDNELKALLKPFASARMAAWPVDKKVGNVKNDLPELIDRVAVQASLI